MLMHNGEEWMRIRMEYETERDGLTVVEKEVPMDYLGLTHIGVLHEVYKEFLAACTLAVDRDDEIIIQK